MGGILLYMTWGRWERISWFRLHWNNFLDIIVIIILGLLVVVSWSWAGTAGLAFKAGGELQIDDVRMPDFVWLLAMA